MMKYFHCLKIKTHCCTMVMIIALPLISQDVLGAMYDCTLTNPTPFVAFSYIVKTTQPGGAGSASLTTFVPAYTVTYNSTQTLAPDALKQAADAISSRLRINSYIQTSNTAGFYASARWGDTLNDTTVSGLPADRNPAYPYSSCTSGSPGCKKVSYDEKSWPAYVSSSNILSFDSSVSTFSPAVNMSLEIPVEPANEYAEHVIKITYRATSARITSDTEGFESIKAGTYVAGMQSFGTVDQVVTCTRAATPLTLTLRQPTLDFNSIQTGFTTPVTRELNWTASGTGRASIWTMTFDAAADKKTATILLGNAKVRIFDAGGTQVPLATPVNISGVTGAYTFELDPTGATPGTPETSVNVTLTAN